jgi:hypothetical protein
VHITGNELAIVSAGVAAVAVVASVVNNRSTNKNALDIAREERASRRKDELEALKRATYAKQLAIVQRHSQNRVLSANLSQCLPRSRLAKWSAEMISRMAHRRSAATAAARTPSDQAASSARCAAWRSRRAIATPGPSADCSAASG